MNDTTVAGAKPVDGLVRAAWVDATTNPKKHGEFEGHLKGEPHKVNQYFWTGRRWMFKTRLGKWIPSIFGEKGDKWRGLCDSVDTPLKVKDDNTVEFPENPVIGAMYHTEAGASWLCNGKRWLCKSEPTTDMGKLFKEEEDKALQSIANEDASAGSPTIAEQEIAAAKAEAAKGKAPATAVREDSEKTSIAKAGAMRRTRSTFVGTGEDIHHDIAGVQANYRNTKDSE